MSISNLISVLDPDPSKRFVKGFNITKDEITGMYVQAIEWDKNPTKAVSYTDRTRGGPDGVSLTKSQYVQRCDELFANSYDKQKRRKKLHLTQRMMKKV